MDEARNGISIILVESQIIIMDMKVEEFVLIHMGIIFWPFF